MCVCVSQVKLNSAEPVREPLSVCTSGADRSDHGGVGHGVGGWEKEEGTRWGESGGLPLKVRGSIWRQQRGKR